MFKVQLKTSELILILTTLEKLKDQKIEVKVAYKLSRILKVLRAEKDTYYQCIKELVQEYGEKDENGNPIVSDDQSTVRIQEDKMELCNSSLNEINNTIITIEIPKLTINDLMVINAVSIEELMTLDPIIDPIIEGQK